MRVSPAALTLLIGSTAAFVPSAPRRSLAVSKIVEARGDERLFAVKPVFPTPKVTSKTPIAAESPRMKNILDARYRLVEIDITAELARDYLTYLQEVANVIRSFLNDQSTPLEATPNLNLPDAQNVQAVTEYLVNIEKAVASAVEYADYLEDLAQDIKTYLTLRQFEEQDQQSGGVVLQHADDSTPTCIDDLEETAEAAREYLNYLQKVTSVVQRYVVDPNLKGIEDFMPQSEQPAGLKSIGDFMSDRAQESLPEEASSSLAMIDTRIPPTTPALPSKESAEAIDSTESSTPPTSSTQNAAPTTSSYLDQMSSATTTTTPGKKSAPVSYLDQMSSAAASTPRETTAKEAPLSYLDQMSTPAEPVDWSLAKAPETSEPDEHSALASSVEPSTPVSSVEPSTPPIESFEDQRKTTGSTASYLYEMSSASASSAKAAPTTASYLDQMPSTGPSSTTKPAAGSSYLDQINSSTQAGKPSTTGSGMSSYLDQMPQASQPVDWSSSSSPTDWSSSSSPTEAAASPPAGSQGIGSNLQSPELRDRLETTHVSADASVDEFSLPYQPQSSSMNGEVEPISVDLPVHGAKYRGRMRHPANKNTRNHRDELHKRAVPDAFIGIGAVNIQKVSAKSQPVSTLPTEAAVSSPAPSQEGTESDLQSAESTDRPEPMHVSTGESMDKEAVASSPTASHGTGSDLHSVESTGTLESKQDKEEVPPTAHSRILIKGGHDPMPKQRNLPTPKVTPPLAPPLEVVADSGPDPVKRITITNSTGTDMMQNSIRGEAVRATGSYLESLRKTPTMLKTVSDGNLDFLDTIASDPRTSGVPEAGPFQGYLDTTLTSEYGDKVPSKHRPLPRTLKSRIVRSPYLMPRDIIKKPAISNSLPTPKSYWDFVESSYPNSPAEEELEPPQSSSYGTSEPEEVEPTSSVSSTEEATFPSSESEPKAAYSDQASTMPEEPENWPQPESSDPGVSIDSDADQKSSAVSSTSHLDELASSYWDDVGHVFPQGSVNDQVTSPAEPSNVPVPVTTGETVPISSSSDETLSSAIGLQREVEQEATVSREEQVATPEETVDWSQIKAVEPTVPNVQRTVQVLDESETPFVVVSSESTTKQMQSMSASSATATDGAPTSSRLEEIEPSANIPSSEDAIAGKEGPSASHSSHLATPQAATGFSPGSSEEPTASIAESAQSADEIRRPATASSGSSYTDHISSSASNSPGENDASTSVSDERRSSPNRPPPPSEKAARNEALLSLLDEMATRKKSAVRSHTKTKKPTASPGARSVKSWGDTREKPEERNAAPSTAATDDMSSSLDLDELGSTVDNPASDQIVAKEEALVSYLDNESTPKESVARSEPSIASEPANNVQPVQTSDLTSEPVAASGSYLHQMTASEVSVTYSENVAESSGLDTTDLTTNSPASDDNTEKESLPFYLDPTATPTEPMDWYQAEAPQDAAASFASSASSQPVQSYDAASPRGAGTSSYLDQMPSSSMSSPSSAATAAASFQGQTYSTPKSPPDPSNPVGSYLNQVQSTSQPLENENANISPSSVASYPNQVAQVNEPANWSSAAGMPSAGTGSVEWLTSDDRFSPSAIQRKANPTGVVSDNNYRAQQQQQVENFYGAGTYDQDTYTYDQDTYTYDQGTYEQVTQETTGAYDPGTYQQVTSQQETDNSNLAAYQVPFSMTNAFSQDSNARGPEIAHAYEEGRAWYDNGMSSDLSSNAASSTTTGTFWQGNQQTERDSRGRSPFPNPFSKMAGVFGQGKQQQTGKESTLTGIGKQDKGFFKGFGSFMQKRPSAKQVGDASSSSSPKSFVMEDQVEDFFFAKLDPQPESIQEKQEQPTTTKRPFLGAKFQEQLKRVSDMNPLNNMFGKRRVADNDGYEVEDSEFFISEAFETLWGRIAMIFIVAGLAIEFQTGATFPAQLASVVQVYMDGMEELVAVKEQLMQSPAGTKLQSALRDATSSEMQQTIQASVMRAYMDSADQFAVLRHQVTEAPVTTAVQKTLQDAWASTVEQVVQAGVAGQEQRSQPRAEVVQSPGATTTQVVPSPPPVDVKQVDKTPAATQVAPPAGVKQADNEPVVIKAPVDIKDSSKVIKTFTAEVIVERVADQEEPPAVDRGHQLGPSSSIETAVDAASATSDLSEWSF